jgi:glyoxylase-like metal-dependent hydrolase (beta-lactamase superfamily II)/ferredoxin
MALASLRRPENAQGEFFVDSSCIDCDTCRWMAPEVFERRGDMSAVVQQPGDSASRRRALHALLACPTASIGTESKARDLVDAQADFPLPVVGAVSHCGYHSKDSFGATSYLVQSPHGNVLVDSPRFAAPLVRRLEALGGVDLMVFTHRDDVADHEKFAEHFGARRLIHARDAKAIPDADRIEGDEAVEVAPGLTAIPVPGHTAGHVVYHWDEAGGVLFGGDHLAFDDERGSLEAWPDVCWYDWGEQTRSMERLLQHPFEWVLPGHGRRGHLPWARMEASLRELVDWMKRQE